MIRWLRRRWWRRELAKARAERRAMYEHIDAGTMWFGQNIGIFYLGPHRWAVVDKLRPFRRWLCFSLFESAVWVAHIRVKGEGREG